MSSSYYNAPQQTYSVNYSQQQQLQNVVAKQNYYYGGYYYGGVGGGSSTPTPTPTPTPAPAAPASPTSSVTDLQVMIAAIPIAQDGQVISAEYHNALRAALIAMANRLGLGTISDEITITNAPHFTKVDGTGLNEWKAEAGIAKKLSADTGIFRGWMELDLPDGARIKKMAVFAANDSAGTMRVKLRRQSVSNSTASDLLVSIDVTNNDETLPKQGDVTLPETTLSAAAIEETRIVDNRKYKYLFIAELDNGVSAHEAKILAVQIICGK